MIRKITKSIINTIEKSKRNLLLTLFLLAAVIAHAQFPAPYCDFTLSNNWEPITLVNFAGINQSSPNTTVSGATAPNQALTNYLSDTGTVAQGLTFNTILKGNTAGSYTTYFTIFIDWNQNGSFTDAGESYNAGSVNTSTGLDAIQANSSVLVPANATLGLTRMRVVKKFNTQPTDPCASTWGAAQDFTIKVVVATCTPPTATFTVVPNCANNQFSVNVNISNMGSATSIDIGDGTNSYGSATATGNYSAGPFASGASKNITLTHNVNTLCNVVSSAQTYNCPPVNDECANAIALTVNADFNCGATGSGTTVNATQSSETAPTVNAAGTNDDVWYKFTATSTAHRIVLSNISGSTDMAMAVYSGSCGSLVHVQSSDPNTMDVTGLTIGQEYKVRVYTYTSTSTTTASFTICVGTTPPPPANDDVNGAASLTVNTDVNCAATTNGTTISATQSADAAPSCSATGINDDVWYKFTATSSAHQFQFSNVTTGTMAVALYTGTPGALVGTTDCGSGAAVNFTDLIPGTLYYARVFTTTATTTTTTNFTVCLGTIPNMSYVSSTTTQISTAVNAGTTNQQIIRMDVVVNGIPNTLNLTQFDFNTTGTTNVADIVNAKVYYTGTSTTFGTTTQFGTTTVAPNGNFTVTGSQALTGGATNTTNYFWLAYDVNCGATGANVLDAQCTAITVGTPQTPTATNPSGTRAITAASFTATTNQPSTAITQTGFVNQQVLRVAFTGCASSPVTSITFNTTGTTNVADIVNAKVYFTTSTTFAATTQFGSTVVSPNGAFTVTGSQLLGGATGYFWLTYDIASNATVDNVVDASCVSGIVNGITATPSTPNPTGTRTIKLTPVNDECINAIAFPTIPADGTCASVTADCTYGSQSLAGCAGTADDDLWYSFVCPAGNTSLLFSNTTVSGSGDRVIQFFSGTCGNLTSLLCSDPESGILSGLTPGNTYYFRVYSYSSATATSVSVCLKTPQMAFVSSTTDQVTGSLSQGSVNQGIIRVNVVASGTQNPLALTQLDFNTTGTTNVADITNAKVYYTGTSTTFSTTTPFGTVTVAPNGNFSVTGSQALTGSNTGTANNYFFLTYDVPCGATVANVLDAQCTNLIVAGTPHVPTETNPTGTRAIAAATYTATTNQPLTSNVPVGGTYQQVLRVDLTGCSSSLVTSITFSTTGSTSASNIANAKVFYTTTTTFAATTQFGSTVVSPNGNFTVTGSQLLGAATAYFWLVYDISPTAVAANVVDASCVSAIVAGNTATPTTANPTGTRTIVTPAVNDEAPGAVLLTVGAGCTTNPYDNTNAFQSISEPFTSCKGTAGYATTWFKFVAPASGRVKVSCDGGGSLGDSRMALYSATDASDYGTFTILACDDDNGVTTAARSLFYAAGLTPGTTYYVSVDLYSSSTTKGTFCVAIDDISSSMIATTAGDCVADQASIAAYNSNYTGWISLVDANGNLNANVRQLSGTATSFSSSRTIKSGTARTDGAGLAYLNRNFLITGTDATSADVQLFFTDAEVTNLGASLASLNVSRVPGTGCNANFTGTATALAQTANGSANGVSHIQFNTPGFSNFYVMAGLTPLPLKLISFEGQNRGAVNNLTWETAEEKNLSHFELQRSKNGIDYARLEVIDSKNAVMGSKYEFTDNKPFEGRNFYRLNMVDVNGKSIYSDVVVLSVKSTAGLSLTASPNPVNQTLNVWVNGKIDGKAMIQVIDITGKIVQKIQVSSNDTPIDMSALSNGTYIIKYNDNSNSSVIKVTKN